MAWAGIPARLSAARRRTGTGVVFSEAIAIERVPFAGPIIPVVGRFRNRRSREELAQVAAAQGDAGEAGKGAVFVLDAQNVVVAGFDEGADDGGPVELAAAGDAVL